MAGNRIIALRVPAQEIGDQRQAERLALFRVELRAGEIVARHRRGDRAAIVGDGQHFVVALRLEMIGMDEIGVQPFAAGRMPANSGCWRLSSIVFQPICGIFSAGSAGVISLTSPAIQPKPLVTVFSRPRSDISCMPTQMPRNGRALAIATSSTASPMPATACEAGAAIGIGADAGQHDAVGGAHPFGIRCQVDLGGNAGFARGALEGLGGRAQIARAVVDDRDAHFRAARIEQQADRRSPATGRRPRIHRRLDGA